MTKSLVIKLYYGTIAKPSYFPYSGKLQKNIKPTQKFQEINDCIFFVIDKDEMLHVSCMEPEALKN